jgi:hypothetical protein
MRTPQARLWAVFVPVGLLSALLVAGCRHQPGPVTVNTPILEVASVHGDSVRTDRCAPNVKWRGPSGRVKSLADLRGKPVVLFFGSCT